MNNILKQRGSRNTSNVLAVTTTTTELIIKSYSVTNKKNLVNTKRKYLQMVNFIRYHVLQRA